MSDDTLHPEDSRSDPALPVPQVSLPDIDFARLELSQEQALILLSSSATLGDLFNHRVEARVNERTTLFREIIQEQNVEISKLRPSNTTSADSSSVSCTTTPPEPCHPLSSSMAIDNAKPDFTHDQARQLIKDSATLKHLFSSNVKIRVERRTAKLRQAIAARDTEVANLQQKLEIAAWEARIKHAEIVELREKLEHIIPSAPTRREDADSFSAQASTKPLAKNEVSLESHVLDKMRSDQSLQSSIQAAAQAKAMDLWAIDEHDTKLAEWTTAMIINGKNLTGIASELSEVLHNVEPDDPSILEFTRCLFEKVHELTDPEHQQSLPQPAVVLSTDARPIDMLKSPWRRTGKGQEKSDWSARMPETQITSDYQQNAHPPSSFVIEDVLEHEKEKHGSGTRRRRDEEDEAVEGLDESYGAKVEPDTEQGTDDDEILPHHVSKRRKTSDANKVENDGDAEDEERKALEDEGDWRWWEW